MAITRHVIALLCILSNVISLSIFSPSRTVICIKRASSVGYEIGLEEHHAHDRDDLSTDSLIVSNEEQAKTIVGVLHMACLPFLKSPNVLIAFFHLEKEECFCTF